MSIGSAPIAFPFLELLCHMLADVSTEGRWDGVELRAREAGCDLVSEGPCCAVPRCCLNPRSLTIIESQSLWQQASSSEPAFVQIAVCFW